MTLVFDFDGTLCDNLEVTVQIINRYCKLFKITPTSTGEFRYLGLKGLLKNRSIPKHLAILLVLCGRWEYSRHLTEMNIFPWAVQIILKLRLRHKIGILTNNSVSSVYTILMRSRLQNEFSFINSESGLFNKHSSLKKIVDKYSLDKSKTYYIGDAVRDIEAAHRIGVKSVGVTWGHESDELLACAHPTILISNPLDLLNL